MTKRSPQTNKVKNKTKKIRKTNVLKKSKHTKQKSKTKSKTEKNSKHTKQKPKTKTKAKTAKKSKHHTKQKPKTKAKTAKKSKHTKQKSKTKTNAKTAKESKSTKQNTKKRGDIFDISNIKKMTKAELVRQLVAAKRRVHVIERKHLPESFQKPRQVINQTVALPAFKKSLPIPLVSVRTISPPPKKLVKEANEVETSPARARMIEEEELRSKIERETRRKEEMYPTVIGHDENHEQSVQHHTTQHASQHLLNSQPNPTIRSASVAKTPASIAVEAADSMAAKTADLMDVEVADLMAVEEANSMAAKTADSMAVEADDSMAVEAGDSMATIASTAHDTPSARTRPLTN